MSFLAQSRHAQCADECPLLGAKRTVTNRCLPISIYEYGLGFGEDDAESGHQITKPVGAGVEMLVLLVGYVPLVHSREHRILGTNTLNRLRQSSVDMWRSAMPSILKARACSSVI